MDKGAQIRKCTARFIETAVDEEIVLIDVDGGELMSLRDTGRAIWNTLDETSQFSEVVAKLKSLYTDLPGSIESQVSEFLGELQQAGLVRIEQPSTSS